MRLVNSIYEPWKLVFFHEEGRNAVALVDGAVSGDIIGPAFVLVDMGMRYPTNLPTAIGGHLTLTGRPNCLLIKQGQVFMLWATEEITPHEPLSIDPRLYPELFTE